MFIITPTPAEEHNFKSKFKITKGNLVRMNDEPCGKFCVFEGHKYSLSFVRQLLAGMKPDVSDLFEKREDWYYRSQDPVWGKNKGERVNGKVDICGRVLKLGPVVDVPSEPVSSEQLSKFDIKPDQKVREEIFRKFKMQGDRVVYSNGKPCGSFAVINNSNYSLGFIKDVLELRTPNVSNLFVEKEDGYYRSQDPVWGNRKNTKVTTTKICGITLNLEVGFEGNYEDLESHRYYDALEVPKVLVSMIKKDFKLINNVLYKGDQKVEHYATIGKHKTIYPGNRYPVEFLTAVLKNEKPNLNFLFSVDKGLRVRSSHPIWEDNAGKVCSGSTYKISGYEIPKDIRAFNPHKYGWLDRVEIIQEDTTRIKYGDQVGITLNVNGIVYTRKYILELLNGNDTKPDISPLFARVGKYVLFGNLPCWGNRNLEIVKEDEQILINDYSYCLKDINLDSCNRVNKDVFLAVIRDRFSDAEDQEFYYAGELIFTGK